MNNKNVDAGASGAVEHVEQVETAGLQSELVSIMETVQLLSAQVENNRIRAKNCRLKHDEQWIPLQREVVQGAGQVAVGSVPASNLIPVRGLREVSANQTAENLALLSLHYGVQFDNWEEFFDYLRE